MLILTLYSTRLQNAITTMKKEGAKGMKKHEETKIGLECAENAHCLIQQLEAENAELLEKIKQLERERDALFEALRTNRHICNSCKHKPGHGYGCTSVAKADGSCWEWRGPCEENTENP